ncbi:ABC transporter permease [Enterovibrio norvegicus FF-33]|uniref:ABC transporter permease n=1 Tax=Enterovibrio norvegicus FF-454 TaxID=1185651 RepID=A0A1E5C3P1_9GAMM|nr:ABC transporter permease subunit [Enterovibrio norvegicus]OEE60100.1 ABC transporter permease [Enterovibrio norvegicus FF-454]OEE66351.1 ABC transporter permease [Enterovibrio norvegicus FF-33]
MIPSLPTNKRFARAYQGYIALFFLFLMLPLVVVAVFSFNDSLFPSLPWNGFTMDWFTGTSEPKVGIFHDRELTDGIGVSLFVAIAVTLCSLTFATTNAFLFERFEFRFKGFCYVLLLLPLVIPGVILGVSILLMSSTIANGIEDSIGWDIEWMRPGLVLVVLGQFAFITTICTLVIAARLRKFDISLEEAALNLGATKTEAVFTITLPFLRPALIGAGIIAFLMSFENFNTTLMLVGSDAPLTIAMFDRLREGSTPVINAVSLLLMVASAMLALASIWVSSRGDQTNT